MGHETGTRIMFLFHWLMLSILAGCILPLPLSLALCFWRFFYRNCFKASSRPPLPNWFCYWRDIREFSLETYFSVLPCGILG